MIKIFQTGDNHFGRKYDNYPEIREILIQSRFDSLRNMVRYAEAESCDFFVITGDLFDNTTRIARKDVREVVNILAEFGGRVLVLPGNHDFYTGEEKVWSDFTDALGQVDHNIALLVEEKAYPIPLDDEKVVFYPAPCHSKHSEQNNLGWIKAVSFEEPDAYHIGIAHGAIEKLTPDMKNQYFLMSEAELNGIPVDTWLIGHTHIPYPQLPTDRDVAGYKIFNAGTHEQTDVSNNSPGCCFLLTLDRENGRKTIRAHSYHSGQVFYPCLNLAVSAESGKNLEQAIREAAQDLSERSVVRLVITGSASAEEYDSRHSIYEKVLGHFLTYEVIDNNLCKEITLETIRDSFPEISLAAKLLMELADDPREVRMAYDLLAECRE